MDDLPARVFWLGYHTLIFITMAGVLGALPVLLSGARPSRSPGRFVTAAMAGYLLAVVCLAFYTYYFIPLQYSRDYDWSRLPDSWSLGESHSDAMDKAAAAPLQEAGRLRGQVERERGEFGAAWAKLSGAGFVVACGGLVVYRLRLRRPGGQGVASAEGSADAP